MINMNKYKRCIFHELSCYYYKKIDFKDGNKKGKNTEARGPIRNHDQAHMKKVFYCNTEKEKEKRKAAPSPQT